MSYGEFVRDLPASLSRHIIAYDNLPNHEGCILHVRGGPMRIDLDVRVFSHDMSQLADLLHELIAQPESNKWLKLRVEQGQLVVVEAASTASQADRDAAEVAG